MKKYYSDFTLYEMAYTPISIYHRLPEIPESYIEAEAEANAPVVVICNVFYYDEYADFEYGIDYYYTVAEAIARVEWLKDCYADECWSGNIQVIVEGKKLAVVKF